MFQLIRRFILPVCVALSPLAGCQSYPGAAVSPPALSAPSPGVVVSGAGSLSVRPTLGAYQTQSAVSAYTKASIQHLVLKLYVVTTIEGVEHEAEALKAPATPIELDVTDLDKAVTFTGLKRQTTYRVKALAYKASGRDAGDLISTTDASSYITITLGDDDRPTADPLKVRLKDRDVSLRLSGSNLLVDDGKSTTNKGQQQNPKVAYNSQTHESLVVWMDYRNNGSNDIYGRRINEDGSPASADFVISNAINEQYYPSVAYNSQTNEFLVTWMDYRNNSNWDIYGQRVSASGTPDPAANFVICNATYDQQSPSVAYNSQSNEYLVTWQDYRNDSYGDIYGQRVSADGSLAGTTSTANFVISNAAYYQYYPSVAYNSQANEFLVTWQDLRSNSNWDIYGQRVSASSPPDPTTNFVISNTASVQYNPSVAYNSQANEYLVTWQDYRNGNGDIYGQRVSTGSNPDPATNFAICSDGSYQTTPSVAYSSQANEFLVTWLDFRNDGYGDIYGQRVSASGNPDPAANFVISNATFYQQNPSVAYNSQANEFLVTWMDLRSNTTWDVYYARVGASYTADNSVAIGPAYYAADQQNPKVAYNSQTHESLVVWMDSRNNGWDIYGRRLKEDGSPASADFVISNATNDQYYPSVAYNSQTNEFLVTWMDIRNGSNWDIYGQRVSASGAPDPTTNFVISNATSHQISPSVAYNSQANEFLVTWMDLRSNSNWDVYGQRVSASGASDPNTNFVISNAASDQQNPSVAYNSQANEFLVTWMDYRNGNGDIYGQRVSTGSNPDPATNFVISNATSDQVNPSVAYSSQANEFLVTWQDYRSGNGDIYGQRVSASGTSDPTSNFVISNATNTQQNPSVAYSSQANEFLVTWQDYRNDGYGDIYGQRVSAGSNPDPATDFVISNAASDQYSPSVAYNTRLNEFLVTWMDRRSNSTYDIYGQRLDSYAVN